MGTSLQALPLYRAVYSAVDLAASEYNGQKRVEVFVEALHKAGYFVVDEAKKS